MIRNVVVISDTHFGCQFGLCPPRVVLDGGQVVEHSPSQAKVWWFWEHFWNEWVPKVTKGEDFVLVHNGDVIDGRHHNATTLITDNIADQLKIAELAMTPILTNQRCKRYFQIRGTEAHVGPTAEHEETLAGILGAIPDMDGNHARWDLWLRVEGALINFTHHIGTTSSASYESSAVYKELVEAYNEAGRWNDEPPDCVVRSHRHRQFEIRIPTAKGYGIVCVTPGWQLKTPFVWRGTLGRTGTPQIGGYVIRHGGEDGLYTRFRVWKVGRTPEVNLSEEINGRAETDVCGSDVSQREPESI
jgi:hypothetical protein